MMVKQLAKGNEVSRF